jgi:hypothetical protein
VLLPFDIFLEEHEIDANQFDISLVLKVLSNYTNCKTSYVTNAATIRQLLEIISIEVIKMLK